MSAVIGIDLGTTGARTTVYGSGFQVLGECYREYPLIRLPGGGVEQDAELWWALTVETLRAAMAQAGLSAGEVAGLSISSQGISVVPVDAAFAPLCPAISWLDVRAGAQMDQLLARRDAASLFALTGKRPSAAYTLPKLMWLRQNRPGVYNEARYFLLPHDFLLAKLTGQAVTDHTLASGTMLYSLANAGWSDELCGESGIDPQRLPRIQYGGQPAGGLTESAAKALGLLVGTPVAVGGQDQKVAALAAGLGQGVATISLGTAGAVEVPDSAAADDRIPRFAWFSPGAFVREGVVNTAGLCLRWLRDSLAPQYSYAQLDDAAEAALPHSKALFYPFLQGEGSPGWRANAAARFDGLDLETGIGDLACAVMEGVAFEIRRNLEAVSPAALPALRIFGGGAKSPLWCRIIANVTGQTVTALHTPEMACLGAAGLAARACGLPGPDAARQGAQYHPDASLAAHYAGKLAAYTRGLESAALSE